jgi:hypothetical protein
VRGKMKELEIALFASMGSGANWVLVTILFQQVPFYQRHHPEGLCIATYMTAVNQVSFFFTLAYCCLIHFREVPSCDKIVPYLLSASFIGTCFACITSQIAVANFSLFLFISMIIGATIGSLQSVIMIPFMTRFENIYISSARGGASACYVLSSLLSIIQSPGKNPRFGPRIFLLIFALILFFPLLAYRKIMADGIGLRPRNDGDENATETGNHLLMLPAGDCDKTTLRQSANSIFFDKKRLLEALPSILQVTFVQFIMWGVLNPGLPFAMNFASSKEGSFYLSIAYEIGNIALVIGDISTVFIHLHLPSLLVCYGALSSFICAAALRINGLEETWCASVLVVCFVICRFIEAHTLTSTYRYIATYYSSALEREDVCRVVGLADQFSVFIGSVITTAVVISLASCG